MRIARNTFAVAAIAVLALAGAAAVAAESDIPPKLRWSFAGPFGLYDQAQLQRGFKVYNEVCKNCHGINLLAFRNLADPGGPGYSAAQATALAATVNGLARYICPGPLRPGKFRFWALTTTCSGRVETPGPALMHAPQLGSITRAPALWKISK